VARRAFSSAPASRSVRGFAAWRSIWSARWSARPIRLRSLDAAIGTIARLRLPPPDRRVRRVVSLMRAAPATCPGIAGLAREAGLSRAHFFRLFEQSTGVTPHVFLNVIKVEHAVRRVVDDQASLADIGAGLGFSSAAQFSHFFRDHVSIAPSAFRAVMRQSAPPDTRATT
jgi:transcriptional regulator GlxA family with amidase domain